MIESLKLMKRLYEKTGQLDKAKKIEFMIEQEERKIKKSNVKEIKEDKKS